jgi:hypothetical protein
MRERAHRESESEAVEVEHAEEIEAGHDRFVGGEIPAVHEEAEAATAGRNRTASELAYDSEDENVKELKAKVAALVKRDHDGDYKKAFDHYDGDKDGGVEKSELVKLLGDAGVGNFVTRSTWANRIIEKLDKGQDQKIQWSEFEAIFIEKA